LNTTHSNLAYIMFNSNSQSRTLPNSWHMPSPPLSRRNRFNDWAHEDDVENTNEQVGASHTPSHHTPLTPTNTFHTPSFHTPLTPTNTFHTPAHNTPLTPTNTFHTPTHHTPLTPTNTFHTPTPSFPPPPTTHSLFSWSLGDDSAASNLFPPLNTPSSPLAKSEPVTSTEEEHQEYPVNKDPLYDRNYYRGVIDTHKTRHDTLGKIDYITIRDVLMYVTLGMSVCDSYLDQITKLVVKEIPNHVTIDIQETSFNGNAYICTTPVFSFEHYGLIAKICLDWALSNPEKLAPS